MKRIFSHVGQYIKETDWFLILCCMSLSVFSVVLLTSLVQNVASLNDGGLRKIVTQAAMAGCGLIAVVVISKIDYHLLSKLWKFHTLITYGLCFLLFTPLGVQRSEFIDDRAWLDLPGIPMFQPTELLKISFIITFAYHLSVVKEDMNQLKNMALLCIHAAIPVLMIHFQGDDGTALVFAFMFLCMIFSAGLSWKYIIPGLAMIPPVAFVAWNFLLDDDKKRRIYAIINPDLVDRDTMWQQYKGQIAIGNGGLWGKGIFTPDGQYQYVPEVHNDFIFSFIGEAVGFIGCLAVLAVLAAVCIKILADGLKAQDDLGKFICVGAFGMIAAQTIINIGMNLSMLPVVGVTLPFLSAGGTSQGTLYLGIGLVVSVYMNSNKNLFFD